MSHSNKELEKLYKQIFETNEVLRCRNKTLFNFLKLQLMSLNLIYPLRRDLKFNVSEYEAKRGRKSKPIPIREAMQILGVSHRTAQDYLRAWRVQFLIFDLMNEFHK